MPALRLPATAAPRRLVEIALPADKVSGSVEFSLYAGRTAAPDQIGAGPFSFAGASGFSFRVGFASDLGDFIELRSTNSDPLTDDLTLTLV